MPPQYNIFFDSNTSEVSAERMEHPRVGKKKRTIRFKKDQSDRMQAINTLLGDVGRRSVQLDIASGASRKSQINESEDERYDPTDIYDDIPF